MSSPVSSPVSSPAGGPAGSSRGVDGVRTSLRALTTRGRAFLSSGIAALLCSILLGVDDLIRVGVLLVALPLVCIAVTTRGRHRLGLARTVTPTRVTVGQGATVDLELSNEGRAPTGLLLLEEQVPYALGVRPRFVIDKMGPRWRRAVAYEVRSDVRGRFALGPMTVRVSDPFGLATLDRSFQSTGSLVVTPQVVALPPIPLTGVWTGSGEHRPRAFAGGSAEDVTTREYRHGDDLRRVHWRSSAHAGELMVRREEQPWQSRATLFVDNRRHVHRGAGTASSLEHAVLMAASVGTHLHQRGFGVRLATADGVGGTRGVDEAPFGDADALLDRLAVLEEATRTHLDAGWLDRLTQGGLLVGIFGDIGGAELAALGRMRQRTNVPLAMILDVQRWAGTSGSRPSSLGPTPPGSSPGPSAPRRSSQAASSQAAAGVRLLTARGWRAVAAGPRDPLSALWQTLAGGRRPMDETGRAS